MSDPPALRLVDGEQPDFTRAMPHNIEAEQVVLGAVMLAPAVLPEVRELIDDTAFYRPAHTLIWQTITALADRGDPYHVIPVNAALGRNLAKAGGGPYLHTLIASVPTTANATYYAHLLRELAYARRVIETSTRLVQMGHQAAGDGLSDLRGAVIAECAAITGADTRGWSEPTPLSATPELPEFPIWALPRWVGEYAAGVAELTQTPPDLAGCLALACLAVAAAGNVWVHTGRWAEPTNLFTAIVLPPGNRKSEVYKEMTAPIRAAEKRLIEDARPRIAEAVIARRIAEADAERTEKAATDAPDATRQAEALAEAADARLKLEDSPIPAEPKLFTGNDATVEKVTSRLAEQRGRFAVLAPEGGKLFSIAGGRYSGTPDLGVFLSGHAGEEIRIERMGRASECIDAATLTIGVCMQPGVLARLGDTPEFREQGLLGRLLICVPDSLLGHRDSEPDLIGEHIAAAYERNLIALVLSLRELAEPVTLTFTDDARQAVIEFQDATEPRLAPGTGDLAHMTDWAGKLVGTTVRIAALLHLAEHHRDGWRRPIDLETFARAQMIGEYFTTHAITAYDTIGADPAVADARAILDWTRTTGAQRFTARDVQRSLKHRFTKVTDLDPGLRVLETHGWIRTIPTPPPGRRGGRPTSPTYEVHPDAL
jgi:uncharacterized protein DUF3987/DnaB helicase-like protein